MQTSFGNAGSSNGWCGCQSTTDLGATIKGTNVSYVTKGTDGSLFDLKLYTDCRTTIS